MRRQLSAEAAVGAGVALSLALGDAACTRAGPAGPADVEAPAATATVAIEAPPAPAMTADPGEPPSVADRLRDHAVAHGRAARRVLYTWTMRDQIEALAKDRVLLTRSESPIHGPSYFDQILAERAAARDPLAVLLRTPPFARARHGWPTAWPTTLGWEGETYGDDLIRVTLRADAWIVTLRTGVRGLSVVDLDDRPVPLDEALRHPDRIGAVYFVHDTPQPRQRGGTYMRPVETHRPGYRDYVICNESMIESWSTGTPEIARALAAEADILDALRRRLARSPVAHEPLDLWNIRVVKETWPAEPARDASPSALYESALAFPNENYIREAPRLTVLVERLRSVTPKGPVVEHRPTAVFPIASAIPSAARPPPRPRPPSKPWRGTF